MSVPNGSAPTPRRTTRAESARQQTPLPALDTRQSHAYGARGKTQLNTQIATTTAEMDAAFTTNARKTRAPTAKEQTPAPATASRARKNKQRVEEPEPVPDEDETNGAAPYGIGPGAGEDNFRPNTRLDSSLSYGLIPDTRTSTATQKVATPSPALPAEPSPVSPAREVDASARPASAEPILPEEVNPPRFKAAFRTFLRYFVPAVKVSLTILVIFTISLAILIGLVCTFITVWMALPLEYGSPAYEARENFTMGARYLTGQSPYEQEPSMWERRWTEYKHYRIVGEMLPNYTYPEMQWAINQNVFARLGNAEWAAGLLKETVGMHSESLKELKRILPLSMAMTTKDGKWNFSDEFLQAFAEKATSTEAIPLWDKLMLANKERIFQIHQGNMRTIVNGVLEEIQVVSQEQLEEAIIENNQHHEQQHKETMASFRQLILENVREIAEETTNVALEKSLSALLSKAQLGSLAYSMLIENTNRRMREVNYLSAGLGAVVVPLYTSPTYKNPVLAQGWLEWSLYRTGLKTLPPLPFVPTLPPTAALRDWKEGAECWCAAPSDDEMGLAQIAVQSPHKIYPEAFYVEHIPASGTRDIAAAPKKYEVWAQLDNATEAVRVQDALDREIDIRSGFECGKPPKLSSSRWVCLSASAYNIHYANYVQRIDLSFDAERIGLSTRMIMFRVVENWGSEDHTCIYRLRLTGHEVGKEIWHSD